MLETINNILTEGAMHVGEFLTKLLPEAFWAWGQEHPLLLYPIIYLIIIAPFYCILMALFGLITKDASAKTAAFYAKLSFHLINLMAIALIFISMVVAPQPADRSRTAILVAGLLNTLIADALFTWPVYVLRIFINTIPLVNFLGPILFVPLALPYAIPLKIRGLLGKKRQDYDGGCTEKYYNAYVLGIGATGSYDPYEAEAPYGTYGSDELPPEPPDPSDFIDGEFEEPEDDPENFVPTATFYHGTETRTLELRPLFRLAILSGRHDFIPKDENGEDYPFTLNVPPSIKTDEELERYLLKIYEEEKAQIEAEKKAKQ